MPASSYALHAIESRNPRSGAGTLDARVGREVGQLERRLRVPRRDGRHRLDARDGIGAAQMTARAKSMLDTIIAAPPSEVAQMSSSRSGSATIGLASTSSAELSLRKRAFGFSRPCREFFTFTCAKSSLVAP